MRAIPVFVVFVTIIDRIKSLQKQGSPLIIVMMCMDRLAGLPGSAVSGHLYKCEEEF